MTMGVEKRRTRDRDRLRERSVPESAEEKEAAAGPSAASMGRMKEMARTGFAVQVLGDPAEDVWNDL